jgi:ribosomal protein L29
MDRRNLTFRKGKKKSIPTPSEYLDRDREFNDLYSIGPKQGRKNMFKTPDGYYKSTIRELSPDSIERRVFEQKKQMFNPKTSKWILDTTQNRNRIKTYKKSLKNIPKLSLVKSTQPIDLDEEDIDYFIDDYEDLPEYYNPDILIDPRIPEGTLNSEYCKDKYKNNLPVDLNKVIYNSSERVSFDNSSIYFGKKKSKPAINIDQIPGLLEYKGKKLNVIQYISRGSFGIVLKYSEETPLMDGWVKNIDEYGTFYYNVNDGSATYTIPRDPNVPFYEIAVKTYSDQNDDEIKLINKLNNDSNPEIFSGMCNTINTKILENNNGEKFAIMDLMDGTLSDLIKDDLTIKQAIEITLDITNNFKCIHDKGYSYTDLKSANVLYKCYKDNEGDGHIKIVLGDIGSICKNSIQQEPIWTSNYYIASTPISGGVATYPPPEAIENPGNTPCNQDTMSWDIGIILLELLGYDTVNEFYWDSPLINKCINEYSNPSKVFLKYIRNSVLPNINDIYDLNSYILYKNQIIGNLTLYDLIKNILDVKERRIKLEEIINGLNNKPY